MRHDIARASHRPPYCLSLGTYAIRYVLLTLQHQALAHWPETRRCVHIKDFCLETPPEASRRCASERSQMVLRLDLDGSGRLWSKTISRTSISHHAAPTGRRDSPPPPSSPSAPPTERSGHGDGSTVQATAAATSTVIEATARRQERIRSGRCGRSGSGRPSLRSPRKPYHGTAFAGSNGGVSWATIMYSSAPSLELAARERPFAMERTRCFSRA